MNGTYYYFAKNIQGDVIGILDTTGDIVATYTYDAWGNPITIAEENGNPITNIEHIGNLNSFRYRGYIYDSETGFYYLTSRYYDPEVCRFINADEYVSTGQGFCGVKKSTLLHSRVDFI